MPTSGPPFLEFAGQSHARGDPSTGRSWSWTPKWRLILSRALVISQGNPAALSPSLTNLPGSHILAPVKLCVVHSEDVVGVVGSSEL